MDIPKIIDFILKYSQYNDADKIKEIVERHILFKTCIVVYDNSKEKEIAAVCRWNISDSGKVATILDLIIKLDHRNKGLIRRILLKGLRVWPNVEYIQFEREMKDTKGLRAYPVKRFLGIKDAKNI